MSSTTRKINWPALIGSILGIVLVGTLLFFGLRYTQTNDQAVAALDTRITAAEQTNSTQQTAIDSLVTLEANNNTAQQGQIDSLAGRIGTAEGEIDAIQANDATQNSAITDLQTGLAGTQNDVGALQDDLTDVISSTDDLAARVAAIEANSTAATTSTLQLTGPVTSTTVSGLTVTVGSAPALTGTGTLTGTTAPTTGTLTSGAGSTPIGNTVIITNTTGNVFSANGLSDVDPAQVEVAVAANGFTNNTPGTQAFLAEPGKLVVSLPICQTDMTFADPALERWRQQYVNTGGTVTCIDPSSQTLMSTRETFFNVPEGGFILASVNGTSIDVDGVTFTLEGRPAHNWLIVIRGNYGDGARDTDRNDTARFYGYQPGHGLITRYPNTPSGGFISEEHFLQITKATSTGGTNCGDGGCSALSVFYYDQNTGALDVLTRDQPDQPFTLVYSNYQ